MRDHPEQHRKAVVVATDRESGYVPVPIGGALPRRDRDTDSERYARLMLILFKPWRIPSDLKTGDVAWPSAFESYREHLQTQHIEVMKNLQLLHECRDSRDE
ncbi:hypothetical protein C2E23DRAFT_727489, partial [Lenzites betulinus]